MSPEADQGRRRLAVVTGGSGGIGEAICRALHTDGWTTAIGYVTRERAEKLASELDHPEGTALAVPLDMTDSAQIRSSVGSLLHGHGRVDALVFNGGFARGAYFQDTTEEDWELEAEVNFLGPVLMTHMCLPGMIEAGAGVFVGVTSDSSKVGDSRHAPYAAAKSALNSFLRAIVREHGRHGIRANCVAPGPIDTPMLRYTFESPEIAEATIAKMIRLIPLGRLGLPGEVAEAVRFLCSDGEFVAGEHLSVGGGVTMNA
jgi:2-hydroxycyclohexanecarboxyl-CoA dehydrogenase